MREEGQPLSGTWSSCDPASEQISIPSCEGGRGRSRSRELELSWVNPCRDTWSSCDGSRLDVVAAWNSGTVPFLSSRQIADGGALALE
jgi:hypothetical protein